MSFAGRACFGVCSKRGTDELRLPRRYGVAGAPPWGAYALRKGLKAAVFEDLNHIGESVHFNSRAATMPQMRSCQADIVAASSSVGCRNT